MENQPSAQTAPGAAQKQLQEARRVYDLSVRRATPSVGLILAVSVFCGAQTVSPAYKGPGNVVSIITVVWFVAELLRLAARNEWRPLRSLPKPRWGVAEAMLILIAVLVGGAIGPHLFASHSNSAAGSWGLGAAVTVVVAACLFAAKASYWRRAARAWER